MLSGFKEEVNAAFSEPLYCMESTLETVIAVAFTCLTQTERVVFTDGFLYFQVSFQGMLKAVKPSCATR